MFARRLKGLTLATLATLSLAAAPAFAEPGGLTVVNNSASLIHPYFKSNCWSKDFLPDAKATDWVFFGKIPGFSSFPWSFNELLDPNCKRDPVVKFTFTVDNEPAPTNVRADDKAVIEFDPAAETVIRLKNSAAFDR